MHMQWGSRNHHARCLVFRVVWFQTAKWNSRWNRCDSISIFPHTRGWNNFQFLLTRATEPLFYEGRHRVGACICMIHAGLLTSSPPCPPQPSQPLWCKCSAAAPVSLIMPPLNLMVKSEYHVHVRIRIRIFCLFVCFAWFCTHTNNLSWCKQKNPLTFHFTVRSVDPSVSQMQIFPPPYRPAPHLCRQLPFPAPPRCLWKQKIVWFSSYWLVWKTRCMQLLCQIQLAVVLQLKLSDEQEGSLFLFLSFLLFFLPFFFLSRFSLLLGN